MNPISHKLNTVERACTDLGQNGEAVTFTAIAQVTGLSRSTLYRNNEKRAVIEHPISTTPTDQ